MEDLPVRVKLEILKHLVSEEDEKRLVETMSTSDTLQLDYMKIFNYTNSHMKFNLIKDVDKLCVQGWVIQDNLVPEDKIDLVCRDIVKYCAERGMKSASIEGNSRLRGDQILWIRKEECHLGEHFRYLMSLLDQIRIEFNQYLNFDSQHYEIQLAEYPGNGAGYVRHYDVPRGKSEVSRSKRRLTCIFYANLDWKEEDGGHLKLYIPNTSNPEEFHLISPIANRLVIFQSEYFAHEVCPSFASRYAITLWMH